MTGYDNTWRAADSWNKRSRKETHVSKPPDHAACVLQGEQLDACTELPGQPCSQLSSTSAIRTPDARKMDVGSLKTPSEYSDDGIYVLSEDDLDSQTVLDLQLELSIIKKRLRSTELAYRALVGSPCRKKNRGQRRKGKAG